MRVLYFSPRHCLPVHCGAQLRDFHLARIIAERASLTYLGFASVEEAAAGNIRGTKTEFLEPLGGEAVLVDRQGAGFTASTVIRGFAGPDPVTVLKYTTPLMRETLSGLLRKQAFDVIQFEGIHLSKYLPLIRQLAPDAAVIVDCHNVESELMARFAVSAANPLKRLYARRSAQLIRRVEDLMLSQVDGTVVCSEREKALFQERVPGSCIEVVGNGVDTSTFGKIGVATGCQDGLRDKIVFVGSMDSAANSDAAVYFAESVWPLLHQRCPSMKHYIVGARPTPAVLALNTMPGIVVTGRVDELAPYYASAAVVVAPIRFGSGTRLKILEALAAGVPIVSTSIGAEGLDVVAGRDLLIADQPGEMVDAVSRIASDPELWRLLSDNGREAVHRYDWRFLGERLARFHQARLEAVRAARG